MQNNSLAYQLIKEAIEKKSKFLDLSNTGLNNNSFELDLIENCIDLEWLNLGNRYNCNFKKSIIETGTFMDNENGLTFSTYYIKYPNLIYEENIEQLNVFHKIPKKLPKNLKKLIINNTCINKIENLSKLKFLKELDLSNNFIFNINYSSNLKNLKVLDLSMNLISSSIVLEKFLKIQTIDLRYNFIEKISISPLLKELKNVFLAFNKIDHFDFPRDIINNLNYVSLSENPVKVAFEDLNNVNIWKGYFANISDKSSKQVQNKYIKLNIIGDGRIGKSQFVKFLCEKKFEEDIEPTEGISCNSFKFPKSNIEVNIWDYGGQNYYHGTHQLFIRSQDANIVMWGNKFKQNKLNEPNRRYNYWLGTARTFSNSIDVPSLFLVQSVWSSENDVIELPNKNDIEYYNVNPSHVFSLDVKRTFERDKIWNLKWNYFINILEYEILSKLRDVDENWMKVHKTILESSTKNIIYEKSIFFSTFASFVPDVQKITFLAYLEYTGSIIYFENENKLKDYIIIKPETLSIWIHNNIAKSIHKNGRIDFLDLQKIFDLNTNFFIDLMEFFQLIFKFNSTKEKNEFVFPQFLPENNSAFKIALFDLIPYTFSIIYLDYFHEGKFFNFMSEYGKYTNDESSFWKFGIMFKSKQKYDIQTIVYYDRSKYTITIHLENKKGRVELAKELFEYFAVQEDENNEKIENVNKTSFGNESRHFNSTNNSKKYFRNIELSTSKNVRLNINEIKKNIDFENYSGLNLNNNNIVNLDFLTINLLDYSNKMKYRVFFSYSHKDEFYRDELEVHFANLKRSGYIETWHDRKILPGQDWDKEIEEQLMNADIVLMLISPHFIDSNYIWNREIKIIKNRFMDKDDLIAIPILLHPCDIEDIEFMKAQAIPSDMRWIASSNWQYRNEAYYEIIKDIRKLFKKNNIQISEDD